LKELKRKLREIGLDWDNISNRELKGFFMSRGVVMYTSGICISNRELNEQPRHAPAAAASLQAHLK